jgi:hypothetical protein
MGLKTTRKWKVRSFRRKNVVNKLVVLSPHLVLGEISSRPWNYGGYRSQTFRSA